MADDDQRQQEQQQQVSGDANNGFEGYVETTVDPGPWLLIGNRPFLLWCHVSCCARVGCLETTTAPF